ncbi:hypothetical protein G6F70_006814 [Rhizopus microsporus]|uniref:Uncharacterized protein n=2 Tax=Rhizopus TaxID=4842 RepID=A0A367K1N3_RHIAZ|nr:hypothetical protein G6F71_006790 [Rhizopus microsporus]RCH96086.1 hypothetical protein CU097_012717 [Rhizopus azygosporus]KAG1197213.1 hypothetical protein G6F70_006814 [Rhizopus microsporus]KAG1216382.1 hypothetical protein G6F69_000144 [Rhizopus microsporus]KAG1238361.1 hypothetical protein G6F67_000448 [Rhizopus microsporus]
MLDKNNTLSTTVIVDENRMDMKNNKDSTAPSKSKPKNVENEQMLVKSFEVMDIKMKELENQLKLKSLKMKEMEQKILEKKERLTATRRKLQNVNAEIKDVQGKLYQSTKSIKVTDDDYSTIQAKLAKLSGKLSNLPLQLKSFLKIDEGPMFIYRYFLQRWPNENESLNELFKLSGDKIDSVLVALLVEKLLMEFIVYRIYFTKIHLNHEINEAFSSIEQVLLRAHHAEWIADLRLKCSKATQDIIQTKKSNFLSKEISQVKTALVEDLVKELLNIYKESKEMKERVEKIVDMAIELNLPMHGQEDIMLIRFLNKGDRVISSQVKAQYRCIGKDQNEKIILGISPVFLAKSIHDNEEERDETMDTYAHNYTVVFCGKAIW